MPVPLVTGVSPKEGPPGTRVTIRGENLGRDIKDLIGLKICGVDCLLSAEWKSPSKIIARTGPGKGKGDIQVITRSGGKGSCTVGFKGYFVQIGPLQESAIWIDESQTVLASRHGRPSSPIFAKEDDDPLGISDEGNQAKFREDELLEMFPESSGNMALQNFSPAWYLLENHHETNFDDLKAGLAYMKRRATQRSEGPIAFVKSNLSSTLDCLDSLEAMYQKYLVDDIRGDCMNSYAVLLMQAKSCADGVFKEVLGRKDKADRTRNALAVLQRFKFLFYLPINIERNIKKGDYNLVINDYVRARSLFANTQVEVFKTVYKEVENNVNSFRDMLQKKLLDLPSTLDEQKKIIGYLINLECTGDPAWECLVNQQKWLLEMFIKCKNEHIQKEKEWIQSEKESGSASQIRGSTPQVNVELAKGKSRDASFKSTTSPDQAGWKFRTPQKILFVEELTSIVTNNFPDLWKLGQAYFSGSLIVKETGEKAFKIDSSKHTQFRQMITDIISLFANLIRAAFLPESLENISPKEKSEFGKWHESKNDIPGAWLPSCVRYVRGCVGSLSTLDLSVDSLTLINDLALDMRTHCMFTLLKQAIADVQVLHTKETWNVETDDEFGGTTQLPALFENIVNETIQHLHEVVVQNKQGEPEMFSQRTIQKDATEACSQLLKAFAPCLECLAFTPPQHPAAASKKSSQPQRSSDINPEIFEENVPPKDKRLIIMLSNCNHTVERVLPRLVENLNKHGYVEMNKTLQIAQDTFYELDEKLFDAYVEEKSNPILGAMEHNMYKGGFHWKTCQKPKGVRNYLKDVIMKMIEVHAEVFAVSPAFVKRVMSKVIEAISEEMLRLIHCAGEFSNNGAIQANLELSALQETVQLYLTSHASNSFKEALEGLPGLKGEDKKLLEELLNRFKSQMKFQMMCFYGDSLLKNTSEA